jgi:hypothetical protein
MQFCKIKDENGEGRMEMELMLYLDNIIPFQAEICQCLRLVQ